MTAWESLESAGFPGYELSDEGEVRNERTGRLLKLSQNQGGIVRVGLMRRDEGRQITLSVGRLVARMFVPGKSALFNTPIHLNNNPEDCRAVNLVWRPRAFALLYTQQFESEEPLMTSKIFDVETSERFNDTREPAVKFGLREKNIMDSVVNGHPCFPTWQIFALV